ncbi:MAG: hypothetical protein R3185_09145 [Candidatus Thermoplasmatota archaeon]|nr:hypothetical protein [Candidatus Thermoplasmatota archaeon]
MRTQLIATISILALLLAAGAASAQTDGTTTQWSILADTHTTGDGLEAHRTQAQSQGPDETVDVAPGTCQVWLSDETADVSATFDKDQWTGAFHAAEGQAPLGETFTVNIGAFDPDGDTFNQAVSTSFTYGANGDTFERGYWQTSSSGTFTVPLGDLLYFELCNPSTNSGTATVLADGESWVETPSDQPAFPTPELGALLLTGLGILGIAGVARVRRD